MNDGKPILRIKRSPVNIIIPTPGTFSSPNPNDNIPSMNIEITTPRIEPDPP